MAAKRDYYEVLGVPRDADAKTIRAAYRRLAREHHPDVSAAPDAQQQFQEIGEAYAVLSDEEKRARYDQFGHRGVEGVGFDFGGFPDIFEMFRAVVGGFGYEQEPTLRGNDLLEEIEIALEDVVAGVDLEPAVSRYVGCEACGGEGAEPGTTRERCSTCRGLGRVRYQQRSMFLSFSQEADCPDCDGTGVHIPKPCGKCGGSGRRRKTEKVKVRVPAGVEDGQRVRLPGGGDAGPLGSQSGDLYIQIRVRPHELFVRRGSDLVCEVPLEFPQVALGDKIEVPGITETHQVTIPAGTQHGQTISVRGGGLPRLRRPQDRGDLHILVRVNVPQRLTKKQRELLLQLASASGLDLAPQGQGLAHAIGEAVRGKG